MIRTIVFFFGIVWHLVQCDFASKDSKHLRNCEKLGDYIEAMLARHSKCKRRFGKCLRDFIFVVERVCLCIRPLLAIFRCETVTE